MSLVNITETSVESEIGHHLLSVQHPYTSSLTTCFNFQVFFALFLANDVVFPL